MKQALFFLFALATLSKADPFDGGIGSGDAAARFLGYLDGTNGQIFGGGPGDGEDGASGSMTLGSSDLLDSDGDGMPDSYEVLNGLNPGLADGDLDADLDGSSNFAEYAFCTDPQDGSDFLSFTLILGAGNTTANLLWTGVAGKTYAIFGSEDLRNWFFLREATAPASGPQATSIILEGERRLFFRFQADR